MYFLTFNIYIYKEPVEKPRASMFDPLTLKSTGKTIILTTHRPLHFSCYMITGSLLYITYWVFLFLSYQASMFVSTICVYINDKISLFHKGFGYTLYDTLSGICITEMLLSFVYCYVFFNKIRQQLFLHAEESQYHTNYSNILWCFNKIHKQ